MDIWENYVYEILKLVENNILINYIILCFDNSICMGIDIICDESIYIWCTGSLYNTADRVHSRSRLRFQ